MTAWRSICQSDPTQVRGFFHSDFQSHSLYLSWLVIDMLPLFAPWPFCPSSLLSISKSRSLWRSGNSSETSTARHSFEAILTLYPWGSTWKANSDWDCQGPLEHWFGLPAIPPDSKDLVSSSLWIWGVLPCTAWSAQSLSKLALSVGFHV